MKRLLIFFLFLGIVHASQEDESALSLEEALTLMAQQNLEIKAAQLDVQAAQKDAQSVSGMSWGKLNLIQDVARSNDAGNVFGFKLTSREANFGDFGFSEFLTPLGQAIGGAANGIPPSDMSGLLTVEPKDLNYPDDRNFFQTKLKYEVPLFTGFALSSYSDIKNEMTKLKSLDAQAVMNEKRYQLRKSYYDMALLQSSITNLEKILHNIDRLEDVTQSMIDAGYAKKVDLLEVQAKKGNVKRLLMQMKSNEKLLYHFISFLLNQKIEHIITPTSEIAMPTYSDDEILQRNLDIQKASSGLIIRKDMVQASQAGYYPTVGAFAEVATADNTFLGNADDHKAYTIGARLSWNLFNGGIDSAKIEKSRIEHLKMQSQVALAKEGIALKIAKIRTEIASADEEIASLEKEFQLANAIYENYLGRYKEKLASMSDVIIKQSSQIEKILQLQVAKNKRNERIFALEKLANGEN